MQKFVAMLFALVAIGAVNAGVVDPAYRCGGLATQLQLRISDCDGYCRLMPGTLYNCENDFMPSSASPSLTLRVEICMNAGFCTVIINTELPNSSVQPGFVYTAKYSVVPNDILSGQTVEFRASILHTDSLRIEVCVAADIDILQLP
ncbi:uncharacterized protein LOC110857773 isoform X3 [Folsomia candida]|uniref:uncharacterized protein LOC110857773 isoform X3 n=1 Tax=Folsomia candida TaxID=158441 RepID=UPI000B9014A1|nr:uncharacterized protein LOC110857773 isoform X3 [Folsomia candida]